MGNLYGLSDARIERLRPLFPRSHGKPRVGDRRVPGCIVFINRKGLWRCDAPRECALAKILYNR
ncbi:hypothetical protein DYS74_08180 [Sinirhodobacter hankyongi]|uniref:Transposase n=1 Tax=Paenirhodobacter hankyongi TaxID=2294033 RepID=A0A421BQQ5_9RHOB|nr:hypothetical protein DYS74_08180 [Sinirhodobacter hankyongi]